MKARRQRNKNKLKKPGYGERLLNFKYKPLWGSVTVNKGVVNNLWTFLSPYPLVRVGQVNVFGSGYLSVEVFHFLWDVLWLCGKDRGHAVGYA